MTKLAVIENDVVKRFENLLYGLSVIDKTDFLLLPALLCFDVPSVFSLVLLTLGACGTEQIYLKISQTDTTPVFFQDNAVVNLVWHIDNFMISSEVIPVLRHHPFLKEQGSLYGFDRQDFACPRLCC